MGTFSFTKINNTIKIVFHQAHGTLENAFTWKIHPLLYWLAFEILTQTLFFFKDIYKPKFNNQFSPKLSNGYILPEGKVTPNAIFVGGIDMKVTA